MGSDTVVVVTDLEAAIIERVNALEKRMAELEAKHEGRLDGHDAELSDLRKSVAQIQNDVGRIFNILTTQSMVLERVDKNQLLILEFVKAKS